MSSCIILLASWTPKTVPSTCSCLCPFLALKEILHLVSISTACRCAVVTVCRSPVTTSTWTHATWQGHSDGLPGVRFWGQDVVNNQNSGSMWVLCCLAQWLVSTILGACLHLYCLLVLQIWRHYASETCELWNLRGPAQFLRRPVLFTPLSALHHRNTQRRLPCTCCAAATKPACPKPYASVMVTRQCNLKKWNSQNGAASQPQIDALIRAGG